MAFVFKKVELAFDSLREKRGSLMGYCLVLYCCKEKMHPSGKF